MKKLITLGVILLTGMARANLDINPFNPTPTHLDVRAAEQNAWMQQNGAESAWMGHNASAEWEMRTRANQARQVAEMLRQRMQENEQRQLEEAWRRSEGERRQKTWRETEKPMRYLEWKQGMISRQKYHPRDVLNPDLDAPLITDAERRILQREQAQINRERATWARRDEILRRNTSNKKK